MTLRPHASIYNIAMYTPGASSTGGNEPVLKLSSNENPHGASPRAIAAASATMTQLSKYPNGDSMVLREAIAKVCGYPIAQTICGTGSDDILSLAVRAFTSVGDEVVYSQHGFSLYPILAQAVGATPVAAPEQNYTAQVDALLAAVTPKTHVVLLANPNNPTGTYLPRADIDLLHAKLPSNVLLVLDGAYAEYVNDPAYSDGSHLVHAGAQNVLVTHTFSKVYGLAALRVGRGFGAPALIDILHKIRMPFSVCLAGAEAAAAALYDTDYTKMCVDEAIAQRAWLHTQITALGWHVLPSQANFLCVDFKSPQVANAVDAHLRAHGIIVRNIAVYGLPSMLRISVGTPAQNARLMSTLAEFQPSTPAV